MIRKFVAATRGMQCYLPKLYYGCEPYDVYSIDQSCESYNAKIKKYNMCFSDNLLLNNYKKDFIPLIVKYADVQSDCDGIGYYYKFKYINDLVDKHIIDTIDSIKNLQIEMKTLINHQLFIFTLFSLCFIFSAKIYA